MESLQTFSEVHIKLQRRGLSCRLFLPMSSAASGNLGATQGPFFLSELSLNARCIGAFRLWGKSC